MLLFGGMEISFKMAVRKERHGEWRVTGGSSGKVPKAGEI